MGWGWGQNISQLWNPGPPNPFSAGCSATIDGMPSTCSQANLLLQDGAGVGSFCDVLGCTATQEDPDTGGLQQITGWEFAGKGIYEGLDENGEPNFVDQ
jgi:hypothetical protein